MAVTVAVRIEESTRNRIESLVDKGLYVDISHFVREAILEKLDPEYRKARLKLQIQELLKDPDAWQAAGLNPPIHHDNSH